MAAASLLCPACSAPLPESGWNTGQTHPCIACGAEWEALTFPALHAPPPGHVEDSQAAEGEATCFYHTTRKAAVSCVWCGRFLCTLCDVDYRGEHWCPSCLAAGRESGRLRTFETGRTHYDTVALLLALTPFSVAFLAFSFITAPLALYMVLRHWRQAPSLIPRSRVRLYLAGALAFLQVAGGLWLLVYAILGRK